MPLKAILNSFIAAILSCILALGFKFIGVYLILLSYFASLPIFIITFYYGLTGIILSSIISITILSSITSIPVGIMFFVSTILPVTLILFEKTKNKFNYLNFISKLTLINAILFLGINLAFKDKILEIKNNLRELFNQNLNNNIDQSILDLAPSFLIISWTLILIFNLIISRIIISKYFKNFITFPDKIINIQLQNWLIWSFMFFLIPASVINNESGIWFKSLALIYAIPVTIQGLCTIHVILKEKKVNSFLIYTFYSLVFLIPISIPLITAIGFLDFLYDLRKLKNIKKVN
ncbi:MAG: hypothetical protein CMJ07_08520 [Pelagibacterales bacterium]|nr:hypothetical protein [Pelagibacterales bacterium]OUV25996.1 MAG: hypothetical protein CBC69_06355 [Alphaproteobacteria bacterium TMED109]|tara:strand:+ start:308 stop:1183 length:876 start_codon:yes stop_codon:yes gene_type:complete